MRESESLKNSALPDCLQVHAHVLAFIMFDNKTANYPGALRAGSHSKTLQQNDIPEALSSVHSSGTPEIVTESDERCAIVVQPIRRHAHIESVRRDSCDNSPGITYFTSSLVFCPSARQTVKDCREYGQPGETTCIAKHEHEERTQDESF